ncbi:hypothetical protein [Pelomonas cellulosilytica]|uniref:Phage coat protein n=1 Tax=Pelomonas cellulosilytica TaxID=2906762 RepID=A0ABS8XQJ0_9BURK|nr:hypothetical protein [Pelomonas sp. P8]MCE4555011.1 hypothetical protein [Pelomonas sp. P8]
MDRVALAPGQACPSDAFVLLDSTQAQQIADAASAPSQLPPSADIAAAWGAGFTLVVSTYAIGRLVGAVVNFIK